LAELTPDGARPEGIYRLGIDFAGGVHVDTAWGWFHGQLGDVDAGRRGITWKDPMPDAWIQEVIEECLPR
jgi:hypothetical protein